MDNSPEKHPVRDSANESMRPGFLGGKGGGETPAEGKVNLSRDAADELGKNEDKMANALSKAGGMGAGLAAGLAKGAAGAGLFSGKGRGLSSGIKMLNKAKIIKASAGVGILVVLLVVPFIIFGTPIFLIGNMDYNLMDSLGFTDTVGVLEKQAEYNNYQVMRLYDGGTSVFKKAGIIIMYCNTLAGNKDIYIGNEDMIDDLKGEYCGHTKNKDESYIRTYKIIDSSVYNGEFNNVTLKQNNGLTGKVLINNSLVLIPGHTYEFTFYTFDKFNDTIENIFKNSTIIKIVETDKKSDNQINEEIVINNEEINSVELNELENVKMYIVNGTLTKTSAKVRITDYSHKYSTIKP